jgi:glycosyltransferase involved in cell wall biosynthesis
VAVAPFSVLGPAGGPRIMRSLLTAAPVPVLAVSSSPGRAERLEGDERIPEVHAPIRPSLGRLERTRAISAFGVLDRMMLRRYAHTVKRLATGLDGPPPRSAAIGLHAIPHSVDFVAVRSAADALGLPLFLSIHDDPAYVLRDRIERGYVLRRLGGAWRAARQRFVISEEMGREMCRRYGDCSYVVVTDGLEDVAHEPRPARAGRLAVYFMGAAHLAYAENFRTLVRALAQLRATGVDARLIARTGALPFDLPPTDVPIDIRPWASQADVLQDLDDADVLYMPLPFGEERAAFVRFSLSTKMVTYLGSGIPLVFHGPRDSAAGNLLRRTQSALVAESLDVRAVTDVLASVASRGAPAAEKALRLARERFMLADIRARFWNAIVESSAMSSAVPAAAEFRR